MSQTFFENFNLYVPGKKKKVQVYGNKVSTVHTRSIRIFLWLKEIHQTETATSVTLFLRLGYNYEEPKWVLIEI